MDTEFFLAGGLAFLLAMLGWSDQIRGTQEKTRLLEKELITKYKFDWKMVKPLIRPAQTDGAKERLAAVLRLLAVGGLTQSDQALLLTEIESMNKTRSDMEKRYSFRFWLVFVTAVEMFTAGILLIYLRGKVSILVPDSLDIFNALSWQAYKFQFLWREVWSTAWALLMLGLFYQTMRLNFDEQKLRQHITNVDDLLTQSQASQIPQKIPSKRWRRRQLPKGTT